MIASPPPLRIYFDVSGADAWHRLEWENMLSRLGQGPRIGAMLADHPGQADAIIATPGCPKPAAPSGPPLYVWDSGDTPDGRQAGFYCSLPRLLFDPRRHRTLGYPIRYNECVRPSDPSEADHLVGFVGGITSGVRSRLMHVLRRDALPGECLLVERGGPWDRMFDRSGVPAKQDYSFSLRRSRFFICPRGNGVGSIRFFETLETGRVPVVISDAYVPPADIDWSSCALFVKERELDRLLPMVRERAADWPAMAAAARRVWDRHFRDDALLGTLAAGIRSIGIPPARERLRAPLQRIFFSTQAAARRRLGVFRNRA